MLVLSFKNGNYDPTRDPFDKYYMPLVEIKGFNPFIDNKPFFDQSLKNKQEPYEKFIKMSRSDGYITRNLLGYLYHQKYYKLLAIDVLGQTNRSIPG